MRSGQYSFSDAFVSEVRQKSRLSSLVQEYCALQKRAGRVVGCCPFHDEKTPSFYVDDDKGMYYCFGCGEKGDVFNFYMRKNQVAFPQAVAALAQKAGMTLPVTPQERQRSQQKQKGHQCMEALTQFYEHVLWNTPVGEAARQYLLSRGFHEKTCRYFRLGFAPPQGVKTAAEWKKKGWNLDAIAKVGNVAYTRQGAPYDRFFGRMIFPVIDQYKQVIAFSGRVLDRASRGVKYMNSPETFLFSKKNSVYNAQILQQKHEELYLVEGFTDVMRLYQEEGRAAVSPMGTAISIDQIKMLWRSCPSPCVMLDGDQAGQKAAQKLAYLVLPHIAPDRTLTFMDLPSDMDPDLYFGRNGGVERMPRKTLDMYVWMALLQEYSGHTPEEHAMLEEAMQALLQGIQHQVVRKYYRRTLEQRLFAHTRHLSGRGLYNQGNARPGGGLQALRVQQKILIAGVCVDPKVLDKYDEHISQVSYQEAVWDAVMQSVLGYYVQQQEVTSWGLVRHLLRQGYGRALRDVYDPVLRTHASFLFEKSPKRHQMICDALGEILHFCIQ